NVPIPATGRGGEADNARNRTATGFARRMIRRVARVVVLACLLGGCGPLADAVDGVLNPVAGPPPATPAGLSKALFVADLHADTLMWRRDLLAHGSWGHVDVPRLRQGGVGLQVFTVVTRTPPERHSHDQNDSHVTYCISADGVNLTGLLS